MENEENVPDCCKKAVPGEKPILQAIGYGLLAHAGCIAFIIASVIGATAAAAFLKPVMMNRYFFYMLIAISFGFATLSSVLYLRKHKSLSLGGILMKKKYLATMYGVTLGINLLLFLLVFPALANVSAEWITGGAASIFSPATLTLEVDIPCPGHAPLVTTELTSIGVDTVSFKLPNTFIVGYNPAKVSEQQILNLAVFSSYPATLVNEPSGTIEASEQIILSSRGSG